MTGRRQVRVGKIVVAGHAGNRAAAIQIHPMAGSAAIPRIIARFSKHVFGHRLGSHYKKSDY